MTHKSKDYKLGQKKNNWSIKANLNISFNIVTSHDTLNPENKDILSIGKQGKGSRRLIFLDDSVEKLYLSNVSNYFNHHNIDHAIISIEISESKKNLTSLLRILEAMEDFKLLRRDETVIAIGGGVLLDLVGLASNLYRRGVPYVKVPTTLLAAVDACVGVKTGINHFGRRNRLGTYYPFDAAYLDTCFFKTLDKKELCVGMGEILKMAVVKDPILFQLLEDHGKELIESKFQKHIAANDVINLSVKGMIEELEPNLWEKDLKRLVDFGHSISPLIEMKSATDKSVIELAHGEAVTLDVLFFSVASHLRGYLSTVSLQRIFKVARDLGLPTWHPMFGNIELLFESLCDTVRHRNGNQNLPLPIKIGKSTFINDLNLAEIKNIVETMIFFSKKTETNKYKHSDKDFNRLGNSNNSININEVIS